MGEEASQVTQEEETQGSPKIKVDYEILGTRAELTKLGIEREAPRFKVEKNREGPVVESRRQRAGAGNGGQGWRKRPLDGRNRKGPPAQHRGASNAPDKSSLSRVKTSSQGRGGKIRLPDGDGSRNKKN